MKNIMRISISVKVYDSEEKYGYPNMRYLGEAEIRLDVPEWYGTVDLGQTAQLAVEKAIADYNAQLEKDKAIITQKKEFKWQPHTT